MSWGTTTLDADTPAIRAAGLDTTIALVLSAGTVVVAWAFDSGHPDAFARPKTAALQVLVAAALILAAIRFARHGLQGLSPLPALDLAVGVFVLFQAAAYAFSVDRAQSFVGEPLQLQGVVTVLAYVASFYLARLSFRDDRTVTWLFVAVAAGGAGVAAYALAQRAGLDPVWDSLLQGRVFASLGQPNALGAYLVVVLIVAAGLLAIRRPALRLLGTATAALAIPALAFTRSRGAFLGLVAAAVLVSGPVLWAWRSRWRSVLAVAGAALLAASLALAALAPLRREAQDVWRRARTTADLGSWDAVQRLALWEVGWAIALDHPVVGAGQETYPLLFPEYRDRVLDRYRAGTFAPFRPESPHNRYVGVAAGSGFVALAAYVGALALGIVTVARGAAAATGRRRALLVAITAMAAAHAVTDGFMTPETAGSYLLWVLLGAGVALATPTSDHRTLRRR